MIVKKNEVEDRGRGEMGGERQTDRQARDREEEKGRE